MKSWLRDDRVYQTIMNGALWIVVIAALFTSRWPQLSWVTGAITGILVVIVAAVYWMAVVCNDNDKSDSTERRQSAPQVVKKEETMERNPPHERHSPQQREEVVDWFAEISDKNWLVNAPQYDAYLALAKLRRLEFITITHRHGSIVADEEETCGKVVVTVGSLRIEIQEDDSNKTTNVHFTSPKTVVTNLSDTKELSQSKPATPFH